MKKVIVLGATGNTGAYLVEHLLATLDLTQYQVIASGRRNTDFFDRYEIEYANVDITNSNDFQKLPAKDVHAVVFLSGLLPAYMEGYKPRDYIFTNSLGALNVLEYCKLVGADRILYAQTISDVLGGLSVEDPLIDPYKDRNIIMTGDHTVYALSKCLAVDLIEHYRQEHGLKSFVFRLPTVYAYTPNKFWHVNGEKRVLGYRKIMDSAAKGETLEVWGDPNRSKDVVYVKDFCQLLQRAITVEGVDGGVFNVGTGVGTSTEDQIKGIAEVFGPESGCPIVYRPDKPSGPSYIMDITNCVELLGYKPEYDYMAYLRDFKREMEVNRFADLRS